MADTLPDEASSAVYLHLAAARIKELHHLDHELAGCKSGKGGRSYQKLPRHMQRRALSSNPKRLPRRLHRRHLAEGAPPRPTKRPASKHRPRPRLRPPRHTPQHPAAATSPAVCGDLPLRSGETPSTPVPAGSAPSRVEDYTRRQSSHGNTWLETHVWHAKRFHMVRRWGYALPLRPTQKMYRPTLRAVVRRCVVQDTSALSCVEVRGTGLLTALQACAAQCSLLQEVWRDGVWRSCTLHLPHRCPPTPVCEVQLWRLPNALTQHHCSGQEEEESRLWMWVHPASYGDLLDLLCQVFSLQQAAVGECTGTAERDVEAAQEEDKENCSLMDVDYEPLGSKSAKSANLSDASVSPNIREDEYPQEDKSAIPKSKVKRKHCVLEARMARACHPDYISEDKKVSVFCLKDTLNRFHLRGPESYNVLKSVLVPSSVTLESRGEESKLDASEPSISKSSDSFAEHSSQVPGSIPSHVKQTDASSTTCLDESQANIGSGTTISEDEGDSTSWWRSYFAAPQRQEELRTNALSWAEELCVQDNVVLPLVVRDPRVLLPCRRAKLDTTPARPARRHLGAQDVCSHSPLYDPAVRRQLLRQRRGDHEINRARHQWGVPGVVVPLSSEEARVPVVVLLQRLRQSVGTPSPDDFCDVAFDVIVPGGWGSNFWMALVYAGAVAVGVDSEVHFMREEHTPPPPYLLPDLPAGRRYERLQAQELRAQHFSLPPDKRPNFVKLRVQFPFSFPWSKLVASLRRQPGFRGALEKEIGMGFSDEVLLQLGLPQAKDEDADGSTNDEQCYVLRDTRCLRALDVLSCRSGSRRRIFRGLDSPPEVKQKNPEDTHLSEAVPEDSPSLTERVFESRSQRKEDLIELQETVNLMKRTCQSHLVRIQVTLIGKGSVEPMALICRPSSPDLQQLVEALTNEQRPSLDLSVGIVEPSQPDMNEEKRRQLKKEHERDQMKLHRLRKAARRRVRRDHQNGGQSLGEALSDAVQHIDCQQQELMSRKESFASFMESLWLLPPEAPLQQCSRLIVGCVTDASFSRLRGCGVGQGFVAVGALLAICQERLDQWQRCSSPTRDDAGRQTPSKKRKLSDGSSTAGGGPSCGGDEVPEARPDGVDIDLPFVQERGIAVLVRNKNSLQYRFGLLTVCCHQPPS